MSTAFLGGLRHALRTAGTPDEVTATVTPPPGVSLVVQVGLPGLVVARLDLDPPVAARHLAELWSVARPVAVSTDGHQSSWQLHEDLGPLADEHGPRIRSAPPEAGHWALVAWLSGRPSGPLPGVTAGASPAYDLRQVDSRVVQIEIRPAAYILPGTSPYPA